MSQYEDVCGWCNGSGKRRENESCQDCKGQGYTISIAGRLLIKLLKRHWEDT